MAKAKIVISGASGLIGKKLVARLSQSYDVYRLERTKSSDSKSIYWNWKTEEVESEKLESIHSLIHLAGEPIASGRWSEAKKQRILDSRVGGTSFLAKVISKLKDKPKSFISASAIGYYGETGDHTATEITPAGDGFLSEVCLAWENTSQAASVAGIRVVNPRIGIVLSAEGGALAQMLPIFKFYLGGALGSGSQYMSCIGLKDIVEAFVFVVEKEEIQGPVNFVAPEAVTNRAFTKTLATVLRRSAIFSVPAFVLRVFFGELAEALLLCSIRVKPAALENAGFQFKAPGLEKSIRENL